jgi:hypothetical protein
VKGMVFGLRPPDPAFLLISQQAAIPPPDFSKNFSSGAVSDKCFYVRKDLDFHGVIKKPE